MSLWRKFPYWEFLPDFIRWYASTDCFDFLSACNTRLGFFGSFGSLACRWCKREKRRGDRGCEDWFIALMALSKMPSEAKDGMSQWGEMVLGAIWAGLGHMASTTTAQKEKMEWQYGNSYMTFGATAWRNASIAQIWFDWNIFINRKRGIIFSNPAIIMQNSIHTHTVVFRNVGGRVLKSLNYMSSNVSLLFFSSQSYWLFWFSFPRAPWRSLQQALPPWKEPIQIQRGNQPGDLEDARSPLLHLHIPGYQNSAESCWGLPWLEVCGPSPGRVDKSAAGKRPYIFQGVWRTRGVYVPSQQRFSSDLCLFFFSVPEHLVPVVHSDTFPHPTEPQAETARKEGKQGRLSEKHTVRKGGAE